eukprot:5971185-Pleurochrysis_carterae.AAC.1
MLACKSRTCGMISCMKKDAVKRFSVKEDASVLALLGGADVSSTVRVGGRETEVGRHAFAGSTRRRLAARSSSNSLTATELDSKRAASRL